MKIICDADDGCLRAGGVNYNTVWIASDASNLGAGYTHIEAGQSFLPGIPWYYIYRGILFFDTSFLPTRYTVKKARICLYVIENRLPAGKYLYIQMGTNSVPHKPPVAGDYDKTHYSGDYGHILSDDIVVDDWNCIDILASELDCFSSSGFTKFFLRSEDEIDGVAPAESEEMRFSSADAASHNPYLTLEVMLPAADSSIIAKKVSLEAIRNIEMMNTGRFYIDKSGNAVYESRFHR